MKNLDRFAELLDIKKEKYLIHNGIIWKIYKKMIQPLGPANYDYSITRKEARNILIKLGGILIRWTNGFIEDKSTEWYSVICDIFIPLEKLKSKNRSEIRRGLRNCKVKKVDAEFIARNGFEVFINAIRGYRRVNIPKISRDQFYHTHLIHKSFDDIIHYWGVFHKEKLIAYSQNYIYAPIEVNYSTIKFHPDFLKLYPSYSLIYKMNEFYLKNKRFRYVNDGWRSIFHQSNIQSFLEKKFSFKKAYSNLHIIYKPSLHIFISNTYCFRNVLAIINPRLKALYFMEEARRKK